MDTDKRLKEKVRLCFKSKMTKYCQNVSMKTEGKILQGETFVSGMRQNKKCRGRLLIYRYLMSYL